MFAFIILHYKNIDDTLECILSIKKLKGSKKIIVVDNHSILEEEKAIIEKEVDDILYLQENIGFAKANNLGCKLAIEKYKPEFLIVLNNDTVLIQKDFITKVKDIAKRTSFDILGSKIICEEGSGSVNPYNALKSLKEVQQEIAYQEKILKYYQNPILFFLLECYLKTKYLIIKRPIPKNGEKEIQNVCLHGCAIIFSKKYYQKYENVFFNETFLFHEEDFLYRRIKNDKLISIYSPEIEIIHKEGSSLNTKFIRNKRKKLLFRTTEILKSLKLLEQEWK